MSRRQYAWISAAGLLLLTAFWQLGAGLYIHGKALVAQQLLARSWQQTLQKCSALKSVNQASCQSIEGLRPWAWADTRPIARLIFPEKHQQLLVLTGASGRTLAFGPGYLQGSAYPGLQGNTVIVGHRDTHFRLLRDLAHDEEVIMETDRGSRLRYRISERLTAHESDTQFLLNSSASVLTLITCYPFDSPIPGGPLRYIVIARRAD